MSVSFPLFITITIPVIAVICYIFLLALLLNTEKDKLITIFTIYTSCILIWALLSLSMRLQPQNAELLNNIMLYFIIADMLLLYFWLIKYLSLNRPVTSTILSLCTVGFFFINFRGDMLKNVACDENGFITYDIAYGVVALSIFAIIVLTISTVNIIFSIKSRKISIEPIILPCISIFFLSLGTIANLIPEIGKYPLDIFFSMISAIIIMWSILKQRFLNIKFILKKGLVSFIYFFALVTVNTIIIVLSDVFLRKDVIYDSLFITIIIALSIAVVTQLMVQIVYKLNDKFFHEETRKQSIMQEYTGKVINVFDVSGIGDILVKTLCKGVNAANALLLAPDYKSNKYISAAIYKRVVEDDLNLDIDYVVKWFKDNEKVIYTQEIETLSFFSDMQEKDLKILNAYNTEIIFPLLLKNELIGILMLSKKKNKKSYTMEDAKFIMSILNTSAAAIKNAQLYEKAKHEALTDGLTGLYNNKFFIKTIAWYVDNKKSNRVAMLLCDLDNFKMYNDLNGHQKGDKALIQVANILKDIVENDQGFAFRYEGEQFSVILLDKSSTETFKYAEKIRKKVEEWFREENPYNAQKQITMSIGIALYPEDGKTSEDLLSISDTALYMAKKNGKNRCVRYNDDKNSKSFTMIAGKDEFNENNEYYSELVSSLYSLAAAIDVKDHYTFYHSCNVAAYAAAIGKAYGLDYFHCDTIYQAGLIHDIGKIGISESILNKPGPLTVEEYELIKSHVDNSIEIIKYSPVLKRLIPVIYSHHERWDGRGYPRKLEGKVIPIESRCLSVADAFDSMVTDRPYRPAMAVEQTLKVLENEKWKQLDGDLVDIFVNMVKNNRIKLNLIKEGRDYAIIRNAGI